MPTDSYKSMASGGSSQQRCGLAVVGGCSGGGMPPSSSPPAYLSRWLPGKLLVFLPGLSPSLLFLEELTHS